MATNQFVIQLYVVAMFQKSKCNKSLSLLIHCLWGTFHFAPLAHLPRFTLQGNLPCLARRSQE